MPLSRIQFNLKSTTIVEYNIIKLMVKSVVFSSGVRIVSKNGNFKVEVSYIVILAVPRGQAQESIQRYMPGQTEECKSAAGQA